ncbi:extracellular protein [Loktanella salsilacus]|jgi:uncharacterized protein (TIGR01370 family)|uniref:Extracellular protein n=1 Tax=Loktanella salsilacus TaxID=195913 RepID=A0A1I4JJB7_9RHOB|nr:endo alpha-1,4 polygalactosaminidase [Loktanella salsilacus]SFL66287.1 extracellular protein [Loktanella salsilacus]
MHVMVWLIAMLTGTAALADDGQTPLSLAGPDASALPDVPTAEADDCPANGVKLRSFRLERALADGFGVQYWGEDYSADGLAAQPHGLLIMEATRIGASYSDTGREVLFSPAEIAVISKGGSRPVLGYLNIGEVEDYRDYWIEQQASDRAARWSGPVLPDGDHLAAYWTPEWQDLMMTRVDRLMRTGIDGLFLDDVLQYYSYVANPDLDWSHEARPAGPVTPAHLAQDMMKLVIAVTDRMRAWNCNAFVVVNNAVFIGRDALSDPAQGDGSRLFDTYLSKIDAVMVENILGNPANDTTRQAVIEDFQNNGIAVLTLDVLSRHEGGDEDDTLRWKLGEESTRSGFKPYFADDDRFNRLSPPVRLLGKT